MTATIEGLGTDEAIWKPWLTVDRWTELDLSVALDRRTVVVAAHPDDEVLGAGGLMMKLARMGCPMVVVWATDGEASHPATTALTRLELAALRRAESERALEALGVTPSATHHLGLPDSGLSDHVEELRGALEGILRTDDLVIAPWVADGHPDHEIAGLVSRDSGCECWQYPVWMWHWASPTDLRVPWDRIRTHEVPDRGAKLAAIAEFVTQIHPIGPHAEDAAVLPPQVLARFVRPTEWIFS